MMAEMSYATSFAVVDVDDASMSPYAEATYSYDVSVSGEIARTMWVYAAPFIFFTGILGNTLILFVMSQRRMRGTSTAVYLQWMAVCDLIVLVTGMVPEWLDSYKAFKLREVGFLNYTFFKL